MLEPGFFDAPANLQWQKFLASEPDLVVFIATPQGVIREWLGGAERITGYTAAEAVGRSISMFFTQEDRDRGLDVHELELVHSTGMAECDRWNLRKDGSRFWASGLLSAVPDEQGRVVALCKVMRDKTDVRFQIEGLESRLSQRELRLGESRDFIKSTAHELRNPLMPLMSAIALLKRPEAAGMSSRAIQIIENQLSVLQTLIDDLVRKVEGSEEAAELRFEQVNLGDTVRGALDGMVADAAAKGLQVSLVLPPAPIWIEADPARLQQILLNLLGNAFKYTPAGGHVDVSASVEADMALVRIEDDGVGIAPEVLPHIFELFTREARQDDIPGSGVGLSVVKRLVALHGGQIEARSPGHDKGSVFGLRLPLNRSVPTTGS